jgi:hypothetical protein
MGDSNPNTAPTPLLDPSRYANDFAPVNFSLTGSAGSVTGDTQASRDPSFFPVTGDTQASRAPLPGDTRESRDIVNTAAEDVANASKGAQSDKMKSLVGTADGKGIKNVREDYRWTLSNVKGRKDIPYVVLYEHRMEQAQLVRSLKFYGRVAASTASDVTANLPGVGNAVQGMENWITDTDDPLGVYKEIWPDNPTNNYYILPFFSRTLLTLDADWQATDQTATQAAVGVLGGLETFTGSKAFGDFGKLIGQASEVANLALQAQYPVVGIPDRPKSFAGHTARTIQIEFPLYNTVEVTDLQKNRELINILATQNHFNKRSFITGRPPVFYRVHVPGQYYSFASYMSNFTVEMLGNMTVENGQIVPDAYEIKMSLTEMLSPSLNQFSAAFSEGEAARSRVNVG